STIRAVGTPALPSKPARRGRFSLAAAGEAIGVATIALLLFHQSKPPAATFSVAETKVVPAFVPRVAKSPAAAPRLGPKSIAVLPFDNLSEDKDTSAFFSDGMHEDVITNLLLIREL